MSTHIPTGYQKLRAVKPFKYALEAFEPGAVLVLDDTTAARLIKSKHAEAVPPEPERAMIYTTCPRCGSAMEYVAEPQQHERWTQCKTPRCNLGWMR